MALDVALAMALTWQGGDWRLMLGCMNCKRLWPLTPNRQHNT